MSFVDLGSLGSGVWSWNDAWGGSWLKVVFEGLREVSWNL
jgi:hypothetical protein